MPRKKISKRQRVHQYYTVHPDAKPKEAAKALKRYGVSRNYVANIKSTMKSRRAAGRNSTMTKRSANEAASDPHMEGLRAAARLIKILGGAEQAKKAVDAAQAVAEEFG